MKKKTIITSILAVLPAVLPAASVIPATQDGWIDFGDGDVKDGGTGDRLNIATPNPAGATQYTRVTYFGFDVSGVDLASATQASITVKLADDVVANYDAGGEIRFTLVDNTLGDDSFDQTILTDANAPGHTSGNVIESNPTQGTVIGEGVIGDPAAGTVMNVDFSPAALADAVDNDTNDFLTVTAYYLGQDNAGYNDSTGLGFDSIESDGTGASLTVVPEPGSALLVGVAGGLFLVRRRRG